MTLKKFGCLLVFTAIGFMPGRTLAQLQRMAIGSGEYSVSPNGSKSVDAYCMDYTRHAPHKGATYDYVLTTPENAMVRVGNSEPITLQAAITKGLVRIEGTTPTVSQLIQSEIDPRWPPDKQRAFAEFKTQWAGLTPEAKRRIEEMVAAEMGDDAGDYKHLVLVNKTGRSLSINFSRATVVGTESEPAPLLNPEEITRSGYGGRQSEVQSRLWRATTAKHQAMLQDAGYYRGQLNGELDAATEDAIVRFRKDHNLGADRIIDSRTEATLISISRESRDAKYLALNLESGAGTKDSPLYQVYATDGRAVYLGNEISGLMTAVNTERGHRGRGNNVYLIMKSFTPDKAEALATSCRIHQRQIDPAVSIRTFQTQVESTKSADFFFSAGKRVIDESVSEPVLVVQGLNKDFYSSSIKVTNDIGEVGSIGVFARAKQVVRDFVAGAKTMFQIRQAEWSPSKIANVARSRMKVKYRLSDEDLRIEFRDQFGGVNLVKVGGLIFAGNGVSSE